MIVDPVGACLVASLFRLRQAGTECLFVQTHDLKIQKWIKHSLMLNFWKRKLSSVLKMRDNGTIRCRIMSEWITMIKWCVNVWRVRCLNRNVSFCSSVICVKQTGVSGYFSIVIDWIIEFKMSHQRKKMGKMNWANIKQKTIPKKLLCVMLPVSKKKNLHLFHKHGILIQLTFPVIWSSWSTDHLNIITA